MNISHLNPDTLFDASPYSFSQVVISKGSRLVHISGQTSQDKDMNFVGVGNLAEQAACAFKNVGHALEAAGATIQDIAKIQVYIVGYKPEYLEIIGQAQADFFGSNPASAATMIGVQALALPEYLIEVEAVAIID